MNKIIKMFCRGNNLHLFRLKHRTLGIQHNGNFQFQNRKNRMSQADTAPHGYLEFSFEMHNNRSVGCPFVARATCHSQKSAVQTAQLGFVNGCLPTVSWQVPSDALMLLQRRRTAFCCQYDGGEWRAILATKLIAFYYVRRFYRTISSSTSGLYDLHLDGKHYKLLLGSRMTQRGKSQRQVSTAQR